MLLAADVAPIDALVAALRGKGIAAVPIFVSSLKDPARSPSSSTRIADLKPAAIVTATAFATGAEPGVETLFDRVGVPVFQAIVATTRREAWEKSQRGLAPADLAMHVVLPELDGRILAGAICFKAESEADPALAFRGFANRPEPDRVEQVAERIAAMIRLQQHAACRAQNRDPDAGLSGCGRPHRLCRRPRRAGERHRHAARPEAAGYAVEAIPQSPRELLDLLEQAAKGWAWTNTGRSPGATCRGDGAVEAAWGSCSAQALPPPPCGEIAAARRGMAA